MGTVLRVNCLGCGTTMEVGYLLDMQAAGMKPSVWVEGKPDLSFILGNAKVRGHTMLEIEAMRCPNCGRIELYARSEAEKEALAKAIEQRDGQK